MIVFIIVIISIVIVIRLKIVEAPFLGVVIIILNVDCNHPSGTEYHRTWCDLLHLNCEGFSLLLQPIINYDGRRIYAEHHVS